MSEISRIVDQLERAFEGSAWHGPSVRKVLEGVDAKTAAQRALPSAHSTWEIVLHMAVWKMEVTRRLLGQEARDLPPEEDWPPVRDTSEGAWQETLAELEGAHRTLADTMAGIGDTRLDDDLRGNGGAVRWTYYTTMHGIIQHDLYHAGQLAVLRKG